MTTHPADTRWMDLALSLGRRSMGRTWPNPAVGCVIVSDGRAVGRGWTQTGGRPHAETMALTQAGTQASGATAYVTLEPCAHHGKTPPCAEALIAAGIMRVVSAVQDPDARVAGKGHAILANSGVTVDIGCRSDEANRDHSGFFLAKTKSRPFVTLKLASSFDGRIATASGESKWITGSASRALVHLMRARHDAVMVGVGTVLADDPDLTVRGLAALGQPVRVICDTRLRSSPDSRLGKTAKTIPVWLCHGPNATANDKQHWNELGALSLACEIGANDHLDIQNALQVLAQQGLTRVFCEGGGKLAAALLAADLVDQVVGFTAGLVLGAQGYPSVGKLPDLPLDQSPRFSLIETQQIEDDVMHRWERKT